MRGTVLSRLRLTAKRLLRDQRGNAFFLTAAALVPMVGIIGSGVDIGRAYMTQLRLQQACDAGVLAGRRAMAAGTYSSAAQAEANKMFAFNFPTGNYGSRGIEFSSTTSGTSDVVGTAKAVLPTALMYIFGSDQFDLAVNCTAKLEISNTDVMMVLDVTGSMAQTNSGDSVNRITALKQATMNFFDTLTSASMGDGRLRIGVVPYSSAANVGQILAAKNPAWLADNVLLPSRTPIFRVEWSDPAVEEGESTDGTITYGSWSNRSTISGYNSTTCSQVTPPADTTPSASGEPDVNQTSQYVDGDGNRITTYDTSQTFRYYTYRYAWSSDACRLQRSRATFTRTTPSTATETPTNVFDNQYRYEDRVFDVTQAKTGTAIVTDTGDGGANRSTLWGGCVMERHTEPFDTNESAPSDALDMDVDNAPTSDEATQWKLLIPQIAFPRASSPGATPSTRGPVLVNSSNVSAESGTNGWWQNFSRYWGSGWGVCPAAARKLTTTAASDRSTFDTYVNSLQPVGGTYHDSGMVWGIRLLSATGPFADENATAPNGRPISRHIVFMTDGQMAANMGNLTFQGYEWTAQRVGGTSDATQTARHNNRFLQLCRAGRERGITIWVVSFSVGGDANLNSCASSGQAFEAANASQLNSQFQAIARQISKLRLSQ